VPGACRCLLRMARDAGRQAALCNSPEGRRTAGVCRWGGLAGPNSETLRSFAVLTTPANATMQALYDGMPVILEEEHLPVWLGERAGYPTSLMQPADDGLIHLWAVSRAVNSVRNNSPDLLDRINDPRAPPPSDAPPSDNPA
jgi:putative SOS response-associated peptidase YedK